MRKQNTLQNKNRQVETVKVNERLYELDCVDEIESLLVRLRVVFSLIIANNVSKFPSIEPIELVYVD